MVPQRTREHDRSLDRADCPVEPDGGIDPGFDEAVLYVVIRDAVEDAILGVLGTLILVGLGMVMVLAGIGSATSTGTPAGVAIGAIVALVGVYVAASTLKVIPPIAEWL